MYAPKDGGLAPGVAVYEPTGVTASLQWNPSAVAVQDFQKAIVKATADYRNAKDEKARAQAVADAGKATDAAVANLKGLRDIANIANNTVARLYFPTIFKIFDKKYVESAMENGTFTVKDLYTKAVGAFNFADLDFLVLGNVYKTKYDTDNKDAIGFNVRVLNTRRAEETYSYSAVVRMDLQDLPIACAEVAQRLMIDILNSHCAQLTITESLEVSGATATTEITQADTAWAKKKYRLFWQPRQVEKDDNTVGDSDNSNKKEVEPYVFYWTLPGQYVISVYNRDTQQIKEKAFSIAPGEVRNVVVEKEDIDTPTGTVTIGGIGPTSSYSFTFTPKKLREQYWWEIFDPPERHNPFTFNLDNGIVTAGQSRQGGTTQKDNKATPPQYRYETQDILFSNLNPGAYDVTITRNPPQGLSGISGVWYVSMKELVTSDPLTVTIADPKDVKRQISDFGLQDKQAIESPKSTKVTFILKPGFDYEGYIDIDDNSSINPTELYWVDKEKITINSEYAQENWDTFPSVTYSVWTYGVSPGGGYYTWEKYELTLKKDQIAPEKDLVVFVDLDALRAAGTQEATAFEKRVSGAQSAAGNQPGTAAGLAPVKKGSPPPKKASNLSVGLAGGIGYATYEYYDTSLHDTFTTGGVAVSASLQFYWPVSTAFGIGVGGLLDAAIGSTPKVGFNGTLDMVLGDISSGKLASVIDLGVGTGFNAGAGVIIPTGKGKGGLTLGFDYFLLDADSWSVAFNVGALF